MATMAEQETVVRTDSVVSVWTNISKHINGMKKKSNAVLISEGVDDEGTEWAKFEVPADKWSPAGGVKRFVSEKERQRLAEQAKRSFGG